MHFEWYSRLTVMSLHSQSALDSLAGTSVFKFYNVTTQGRVSGIFFTRCSAARPLRLAPALARGMLACKLERGPVRPGEPEARNQPVAAMAAGSEASSLSAAAKPGLECLHPVEKFGEKNLKSV